MQVKSSKGGSFFGFIIFIIIAVVMNIISGNMKDKGRETLTWPHTKGKVVVSEVESKLSKDSDGNRTTMYFADIVVDYMVDGEIYQTSQIDSSGGTTSSSSRNMAQKTISKYRKGSTVDVYYNDEFHGEAILEPGIPKIANILGWVSIGLFVLGGLLFIRVLFFISVIAVAIGALFKFGKKKQSAKPNPMAAPTPSFDNNPVEPTEVSKEPVAQNNSDDDGFSI
jgi:hypothetical protein